MSSKSLGILILVLIISYFSPVYAKAAVYMLSHCDNSGKVDVSTCLQNAVNLSAKRKQKLLIPTGQYLISKTIILQSGIYIEGKSAVIIPNLLDPWRGVLNGHDIANITIDGITIRDTGGYSAKLSFAKSKITNESVGYVGFSNPDVGIYFNGKLLNVIVKNCTFEGLHNGIKVEGTLSKSLILSQRVLIEKNNFKNIGASAIRVVKATNVQILNNQINQVRGNMVLGSNPQFKESKFADGIYLESVKSVLIANNKIQNIHRIGIVVEGEGLNSDGSPQFINSDIKITKNVIANVNSCVGTEYNAGVWIEPYNNESTGFYKTLNVLVSENDINNENSLSCNRPQYGIRLGAFDNRVINNRISNFINPNSAAICYSFGRNEIESNQYVNNITNIFQANDNRKFSKLIIN